MSVRSESGFIDAAQQTLEYTLWIPVLPDPGIPKTQTIVLLHEGLGCVALWRDFPELLCRASGRRVFAYSRAGYGASSPCQLPRPLDYMTQEATHVLPQVLQQLDAESVLLLGHSDGASIATIYAGAALAAAADADERLVGIILIAPHFFTEPIAINAIRKARQQWESSDLRDRLARYHGDNVDCAFNGWNNAWLHPEFSHFDLREHLREISVPALLVQGEDDRYGTLAQLETARSLLGRSNLGRSGSRESDRDSAGQNASAVRELIIPTCDHSPHIEHPSLLLDEIVLWLSLLAIKSAEIE